MTPTTLTKLGDFLTFNCYQPNAYCIEADWAGRTEAYCIGRCTSGFEIFFVERGRRDDALEIHGDEASACLAFIKLLDRDRCTRSHCIAYCRDREMIEFIAQSLSRHGVNSCRNDIPSYGGETSSLFRLFVHGNEKNIVDELVANGQLVLPKSS